jgi:antitoxin CptB
MADPRLSRLRWRCRRGMRELDALFGGWLDRYGESASPERLAAFAGLLDVEDDQLWAWCMGRAEPPRDDWRVLIDECRAPR